jgi:hypothetical protein
LTVPPAPGGPVPPKGNKLSMAASTASHEAAPPPPRSGPPVRKKKNYTKAIVGWVSACAVIGLGIAFGPGLYAKYFHHDEAPAPDAAAVAAATNEPPPPPPELSTEEIMQKVADTYSGLDTLAMKGESAASIDASGLNPTATAVQSSTTTVALQMGRTNSYRMDWERTVGGRVTTGAAWNSGKGNYVRLAQNPPERVKSRQVALATAAGASAAVCNLIAEIFFSDTNNFTRQPEVFAKTNGPVIQGQNCYILNGELNAHNLVVWVNKNSFLIPQIEFDFGGKLDTLILTKLPMGEREKLKRMAKLKGNMVDTYDNMATNLTLASSAFEAPYLPADAAPSPRGGRSRRDPPGRETATRITRRVTQPQE